MRKIIVCRLDLGFDTETCFNMTHSGRDYNQTAYSMVKEITTNLEVNLNETLPLG